MSYELAFSAGLLDTLNKLSKSERKAFKETLDKVGQGNESVHVHKLEGVPFVSFGINRNAMRVICQREGNVLLICHVGAHDPAYDWARRHKVLQVGRTIRIMPTLFQEESKEGEASESSSSESYDWSKHTELLVPGPLHGVGDLRFQAFDVGAHAARVFRSIPSEDALLEMLEHFPLSRANALMGLATTPDDLTLLENEYLRALESEKRGEPTVAPTLSEAISDNINAGSVWKPDSAEQYEQALTGDFAAWRVFLHPSQRRTVKAKAKAGVTKVTGGPGTGKTVVALHRAVELQKRHGGTVLLTTFNATLARQLGEQLDQLAGRTSEVRKSIEVMSLSKLAQTLLRQAGLPHALVTEADECWRAVLLDNDAEHDQRFYVSEREHVLAREGTWTEAAYLRVRRRNRGTRLDRRGRRNVWRVLQAFEQRLLSRGGGDQVALAREATKALVSRAVKSPYRAVICDEVQDVSASELRMLAALARDDSGCVRPDGLTLCGDGHQRIYSVPVAFKQCGIETRGRASRKLRLNYRTTDAIRRHAVATVEGLDLDAIEEHTGSPLDGYRSLRLGTPPELHTFDSVAAEVDWIAEQARTDEGQLLVLARTKKYLEALQQALESRALKPRILKSTDSPSEADSLLLSTLHRSKGLEAPRVIIAGEQLVPLRYRGKGDDSDKALWARREKSLLYVGMTRARDWCAVVGVG